MPNPRDYEDDYNLALIVHNLERRMQISNPREYADDLNRALVELDLARRLQISDPREYAEDFNRALIEIDSERRMKMCNELPERVIEKILCRIPFPYIWKVLMLSRFWANKFSTAFQPSKYLFDSFREEVNFASHRWPLYAPVFVHEGQLIGYDRKSKQWLNMIVNQFIPLQLPLSKSVDNRFVAFSGSLICVVQKDRLEYKILVANVMNGSWKLLTAPNLLEPPNKARVLDVPVVRIQALGSDGYKIYILNAGMDMAEAYQWDSRKKMWQKTYRHFRRSGFFSRYSALLSGYTYYVIFSRDTSNVELLKCKIEEGTWTKLLTVSIEAEEAVSVNGKVVAGRCRLLEAGIFLCGLQLMLLVLVEIDILDIKTEPGSDTPKTPTKILQVRVYELTHTSDEELAVVAAAKSPPEMLTRGLRTTFISDGGNIYISQFMISSTTLRWSEPRSIHMFDLYLRTWKRISTPPRGPYSPLELTPALSPFEPGLNPFAMT